MRFKLHPLYILLGIIYTILGQGVVFLSYFFAVTVHELGHLVYAKSKGITYQGITLYPFGGEIKLGSIPLSKGDEIKLAILGPLVNIVIAILIWGVWWVFPECYPYTSDLQTANLFNGVLNLIPVYPLDGGRVLSCLCQIKMGRTRAIRLVSILGYSFIAGLLIFGIFLSVKGNFSLVILCIFLLAAQMEMHSALVENDYLLGKKSKMLKSGGISVTHIMAHRDMPIFRLLAKSNGANYYIFHIVDSDFNEFKILTEKQIYELAATFGVYTCIGDVI